MKIKQINIVDDYMATMILEIDGDEVFRVADGEPEE